MSLPSSSNYLTSLNLHKHVAKFDAAGFESESDLREEFNDAHWTIADLIENFSLPKPHAKKLFKFLSHPASGGGGGSAAAQTSAFSLTDIAAARGSNTWDFFLSHAQAESGPQMQTLASKLEARGFNVWFDMWDGRGSPGAYIDVTKEGMMRGVRDSAIFILVLSKSVFTRPFCRLEIMTALEARKPFVTLFETDARFGRFDFGAPTEGVPDAFHPIIAKITSGVCADPLRRSHDENELMVNHIARKHIEGRGHVLDVPAHILAEADAPGSSVTVASVPALKMSSSAAETAAHATMREALSAMERYAQEVGGGAHPRGEIFFVNDPYPAVAAAYESTGAFFEDFEFPAAASSIACGPGGLDTDEECAEDYTQKAAQVEAGSGWRRLNDPERHSLLKDGSTPRDVGQGSVGDCWLMSALSSTASQRPELIPMCFNPSEGISPCGAYSVRLFVDGKPVFLLIDDRIPCAVREEPIFGRSTQEGELWPSLLEKAFAKWAGCYNLLRGGLQNSVTPIGSLRGMQALCGWKHTCEIDVRIADGDALWGRLELMHQNGRIITCSGASGEHKLVAGHVYSLLRAVERGGLRLVCLRNPWGHAEWDGDFSDDSTRWTEHTGLREELGLISADDGVFWMQWCDFMAHWTWLMSCGLSQERGVADDVVVSGAGCDVVNGVYRVTGKFNGYPLRANSETGLEMWRKNGSQWRIGRTNDYYYVCNEENPLCGPWELANFQANPEAREPAPLLISEGGIAWRGEANEMRCGEAFDVKFELGPAVTWAGSTADTSWTNGAYVELWKVGGTTCIDYYRLHESRKRGFRWKTAVTEPGEYRWVLKASGDPFPPQYAAQTVMFV